MNKLKVIIAGVLAMTVLAFATVPVANAQYNLRNGADAAKGDGAAKSASRAPARRSHRAASLSPPVWAPPAG